MADISRAMQSPPPGTPAPVPQPAPPRSAHAGGDPTKPPVDINAAREAKNERDRLRRKAKRAADAKAAKAAAAKPKKKKVKVRKQPRRLASLGAMPARDKPKKRGRGRPPGAKNKPKAVGLTGMPILAAKPANQLVAIQRVIDLMNAMPEHARKVVMDAVK